MFCQPEPWEQQYFNNIECNGVTIPVDDCTAFQLYPQLNWVYNKMSLANWFGIRATPHGIIPKQFPVFSKPIYNMWGMGMGAKILHQWHPKHYRPGHMLMPFFGGVHYSIDVAVHRGVMIWHSVSEGIKDDNGSFIQWNVNCIDNMPANLQSKLTDFIKGVLSNFTGIINVEAINANVIECHLRMSTQWPDLYHSQWLSDVVKLYRGGDMVLKFGHLQPGYSCVLREKSNHRYQIPQYKNDKVSSIQYTFHPNINPDFEAHDEFSYRIAVVNGFDLDECKQAIRDINKIIRRNK